MGGIVAMPEAELMKAAEVTLAEKGIFRGYPHFVNHDASYCAALPSQGQVAGSASFGNLMHASSMGSV